MEIPSEEFDIDDFLDSPTAERVQLIVAQAVYLGTMKAYWRIFAINLALAAVFFLWVSIDVMST